MRIVSWNIRAGGGRRIDGILAQLVQWQPDVVALSEFRGTPPSQQLARQLHDHGFTHQLTTADADVAARNALLLAARAPLAPLDFAPPHPSWRWLAAAVGTTSPITICLVHVPNRVSGQKYSFQDDVLSALTNWSHGYGLLVGDTNSGMPGIDEESRAFNKREAAWLESLHAQGWVDTFRHLRGEERIFSWYSPNGNNGFRLDQAFANPSLLPLVRAVHYAWGKSDGDARRDALSDHAALIIDLDCD